MNWTDYSKFFGDIVVGFTKDIPSPLFRKYKNARRFTILVPEDFKRLPHFELKTFIDHNIAHIITNTPLSLRENDPELLKLIFHLLEDYRCESVVGRYFVGMWLRFRAYAHKLMENFRDMFLKEYQNMPFLARIEPLVRVRCYEVVDESRYDEPLKSFIKEMRELPNKSWIASYLLARKIYEWLNVQMEEIKVEGEQEEQKEPSPLENTLCNIICKVAETHEVQRYTLKEEQKLMEMADQYLQEIKQIEEEKQKIEEELEHINKELEELEQIQGFEVEKQFYREEKQKLEQKLQELLASHSKIMELEEELEKKDEELVKEQEEHLEKLFYQMMERVLSKRFIGTEVRAPLWYKEIRWTQEAPLPEHIPINLSMAVEKKPRTDYTGYTLTRTYWRKLLTGDLRIFKRRKERGEPISLVLLIDCSGSMQSKRDATIKTAVSLSFLEGVNLCIAGFSENEHGLGRIFIIKNFDDEVDASVFTRRIASLRMSGWTPTWMAITWSAQQLLSQRGEHKLIFIITDGVPESSHWGRKLHLDRATRRAVVVARKYGIDTHCFFIGREDEYEIAKSIFGENRTYKVEHLSLLPRLVIRVLRGG